VQACADGEHWLGVVAGGYHELLLGPEKEEVIAIVTSWIVQHAAGAAASTEATTD
jgi:hypothetical protein